MNNSTCSHLSLQEYCISDLLYCPPSRIRSNSHSVCEQSRIHLLSQQNSLITMPTSRTASESFEEKKPGDSIPPSDGKSTITIVAGARKTSFTIY